MAESVVLYNSTGYGHVCVILDDKSVKCWGKNVHGQLDVPNEVVVSGGKQVSAGKGHTCTIVKNSAISLVCWGRND